MNHPKPQSDHRKWPTSKCLEHYLKELQCHAKSWNHLYRECPRLNSTKAKCKLFHTDVIADWLCPSDESSPDDIFNQLIKGIGSTKSDREDYTRIGADREAPRLPDPALDTDVKNYERFIEKYILDDFVQNSITIPTTLYDDTFSQLDTQHGLGEIKFIEIPLEEENGNKRNLGAIDVVAYNDNSLYICELKRALSSEGILRCLLEAFTYAETIKHLHGKFLDQMKASGSQIVLCPLFFKGSATHHDFLRLSQLKLDSGFNRVIARIKQCGYAIRFAVITPEETSPNIQAWINFERENERRKTMKQR